MLNALHWQLLRFGFIGVLAAIVHISIVIGLVQHGNFLPLVANVVGFLVAFQVSYFGHRYFTFHQTNAAHRVAAPRLLVIATTMFILNEGLYFLFLLKLNYIVALIITLLVLPLITFVMSKRWAFCC